MSSVLRFTKQIPTDEPYFVPLITIGTDPSNVFLTFVPDNGTNNANQPPGYFISGIGLPTVVETANNFSSTGYLLRDMGRTVVSAGRTFRRVQVLDFNTTGNQTFNSSNQWVGSREGVNGPVISSPGQDSSYRCYYIERGWYGQGKAAPFTRFG